MVWRTLTLLCKQETSATSTKLHRKSNFLDRLRLVVTGGPGGSGYPKINGVGGPGGSVYVAVNPKKKLTHVLSVYPDKRVKGGAGANSATHQLLGKPGADVTIEVPPGVTVIGPNNTIMADLVEADDKILVAKGGDGGDSRNNFCGRKGDHAQISLFLKLIADIGFVGFPNAGKSTLLGTLSRARPKVANYPFTTLKPSIGKVEYDDHRQISCADLPGLIEGAHKNVGLGHSFLRHVERTYLLLFVIDINGFCLNPQSPHRDAYETVMSLNKEIELYDPDLLKKPALLVLNKMDTEGAEDKLAMLQERLESEQHYEQLNEDVKPTTRIEFKDTISISAETKKNIEILKQSLRKQLDDMFERDLEKKRANVEPTAPRELQRQLM